MSAHQSQPLVTINTLQSLKAKGEKFTCLTAYESTLANIISQAGVEVILVGDSLGMVIQGHESTLPVTMDDLIYHLKNVSRGNVNSHLMADMPFYELCNQRCCFIKCRPFDAKRSSLYQT